MYNLSAFSIEYVPWWEEVEDTDSLKASARRRRNAKARLAGPFVMPPGSAERTRNANGSLLLTQKLTAATPRTRSAQADLVVYRALEGDAQRVRQAMDASLEKPGYIYGTAQRVRQAEGSLETRHFARVYSGGAVHQVRSPDPSVTLISDYQMTVRDWGPRPQKGTLTLSGAAHRSRQAVATTQADGGSGSGDPVMLATQDHPATAERVRSGEADLQRVLVMDGDGERVRLAEGNLNRVMALEGSALRTRDTEGHLHTELWRVPTDDDFKAIEIYLGMSEQEADDTSWRGTDEGEALAADSSLWKDYQEENRITDPNGRVGESGLDLLPGGARGRSGGFDNIQRYAYCVSSTPETSPSGVWRRSLWYAYSTVSRLNVSRGIGHAVRVLRDDYSNDPDGTIYTNDYEGNDGKKYDSVKIGDYAVINTNLDETKYADGTDIPIITDSTEWENDTTGARCYYNNDEATYGGTYGSMYNFYVIENAAGLVNHNG